MVNKTIINWSEYSRQHNGTTWFPEGLLDKYAKGKILDIGCGIGKHLGSIKNFEKKCGIDSSELAVKRSKASCPDCHFVVGSAYNLPYEDNFFDLVYSIDVIEHLEYPPKMLIEAKRVLKTSGILIIQTPNYPIKRIYDFINWLNPKKSWRKTWRDDPTHFSKFSYFRLRNLLNKYFKIIGIKPRNILLENRIKPIKKLKNTFLGKIIGQKIIIICQK
ncbi:Ubiquinone biosynthesis O-methyltransferase [subsurface metagenome]